MFDDAMAARARARFWSAGLAASRVWVCWPSMSRSRVIDEVLVATGRVQQRIRRLPARVTVLFILGLALFSGVRVSRGVAGIAALRWRRGRSGAVIERVDAGPPPGRGGTVAGVV